MVAIALMAACTVRATVVSTVTADQQQQHRNALRSPSSVDDYDKEPRFSNDRVPHSHSKHYNNRQQLQHRNLRHHYANGQFWKQQQSNGGRRLTAIEEGEDYEYDNAESKTIMIQQQKQQKRHLQD